MHEIFFETVPYSTDNIAHLSSNVHLAMDIINENRRPEIPMIDFSEQETLYLLLAQQCWTKDAEKRPNFDEIHNVLQGILKVLASNAD
jgi:hypothetical protein